MILNQVKIDELKQKLIKKITIIASTDKNKCEKNASVGFSQGKPTKNIRLGLRDYNEFWKIIQIRHVEFDS